MTANPLINETVLQMKYARIIHRLADSLSVDEPRALELFYDSAVYQYMSNKQCHLHNMSDDYVVDELLMELGRRQC